jgi:hypothetical protein
MVYVVSKSGNPLMPTDRHGKVRHLLNEGLARVISRTPFKIQLLFDTTEFLQPVILGVDAGSKFIGISAATKTRELYSSEVTLRTDLVDNLSTRKEFRKCKRAQLGYREPRFYNRKKIKGKLAPSVRHRLDSHLKIIAAVCKFLPVTKIIVETASFDIQKILNPSIQGVQYQQGPQMDFWNVREYVLFRDGHSCQHCHGKSGDFILVIHHLESRLIGGDAPNNLLTLCRTCHLAHHAGTIHVVAQRGQSFRDAAFMGIMRPTLLRELRQKYPDVKETYGCITKNVRIANNLPKDHRTDALCITGNPNVQRADVWYKQAFVRKNNRSLQKANLLKGGRRKNNKAEYEVKGFRLFDTVLYEGRQYIVYGRRRSGFFDIRTLDGEKVNKGSVSCKKLKLVKRASSLLTEKRQAIPPPC